ncbi:hypothetical protein PVAR5_0844 [Paecilomyces variotii No. 5]|uniref:Uncharacterized protein n=1 Tax=Byssochlamys spectabilis (strain No. 5 / NBRC 109023) TaxID=1356009 RepID=V5F8H8_BYSSN|nr:hypothetical protein PVAR5_0844 [Paecilomyces variotii No. 5]
MRPGSGDRPIAKEAKLGKLSNPTDGPAVKSAPPAVPQVIGDCETKATDPDRDNWPLVFGSVLGFELKAQGSQHGRRVVQSPLGGSGLRHGPGEIPAWRTETEFVEVRLKDRNSVMESGLEFVQGIGQITGSKLIIPRASHHITMALFAYAPNLSPSLHKLTEMTPSSFASLARNRRLVDE